MAASNDELMKMYVSKNNVDGVKKLLEENKNLLNEITIEHRDEWSDCWGSQNWDYGRFTPLSIAVGYKHIEMIKFLLGQGADVNQEDCFGRSPLFYAFRPEELLFLLTGRDERRCKKDNAEMIPIVNILFAHGAKMKLNNEMGEEMGALLNIGSKSALFKHVVLKYIKNDRVLEYDLIRRYGKHRKEEIDRLLNKEPYEELKQEKGLLNTAISFLGIKKLLTQDEVDLKCSNIQDDTGNFYITNGTL